MNLGLSLSKITRRYGESTILSDCSISFDAGSTTVLMGPNGSGKSTLLRIAALLEDPDEGDVQYHHAGVFLPKDLTLRRKVTLVLPGIGVFNATVFKNVAYGLRVRGMDRQAIESRVDMALDAVGLKGKRDRHARTLSSGETQRLGIARAMVIEPEALFLDEPTTFIDQGSRAIVEEIIVSLRMRGATIVFTTHDREEAERLGDRIVFISAGRIV